MRPSFLKIVFFALSAACVSAVCAAEPDLETQFQQPPPSAKPRTWWHWVSGNVSSAGITADLQAMKDIGLGGCQLFTVDQSQVHGPVKFMSPEWRGFVKQALGEADRLGLEVSIEGCDGWSESGGPWIQPEQGMQHVVWTEKNVTGGREIALDLPPPPATRGFYRDIALLAFPMLKGDDLPLPAALQCSVANVDGARLIDGDADTGVDIRIKKNSPVEFDLTYARPVTCDSLTITGDSNLAKAGGDLQAGADGVTFTNVGPVKLGGVSAFPTVTATHFRLKFPKVSASGFHLSEISLTGARVDDLAVRAGMQPKMDIPFTDEVLPADQVIDPAKLVDLTGKAKWKAPPGRWTLVRIGHTGTGATTHPSTTPGLECDKLSRAAVRYHFEHMYGPILADSPNEAGRAFNSILLDSWECGCANWTPLMPKEFSERRGYDIRRWLPVFTGRVVKDADSTQRFLWDLRRTIADLLTENHYGVAREFAHEHHLKFYAEAPGIGLPTVADNLACKGRTDIPMGEFWVNRSAEDNVDDPKEAASAAHIYGKPVVATESFTSTAEVASWANDPYGLKQLGDMEFCLGVNRFIFHRYAHQPWNDRVPGMSMGPWGINFERSNTWWKDGSAWIDYLSRCQYLLQQGRFVADVLYFYGEGAAAGVAHRSLKPEVPAGFDYDVCNAEILLNQMSVDHGDIVLNSGMRYRVLVLPDTDRMTLPVLKKIASLVRDGATVYGPKPARSPSLADHDAAVRKLAATVWGGDDGVKVTSHAYGKGRVLWGESLAGVLPAAPDFSASQPAMKFIHRHAGDAEIYFVSNQRKFARTVDCAFRIAGKVPELWHPDTGSRETLALYRTTNGVTTVPVQFDPVGSVFVVFREAAPADHVVSVSLDGKPLFAPNQNPAIEIQNATYGLPGDPDKSRDVTSEVKRLVTAGTDTLAVADFNQGGDPAFGTIKTLTVEYMIGGQARTVSAREGGDLSLAAPSVPAAAGPELSRREDGTINLQAFAAGDYTITLASGKTLSTTAAKLPAPLAIEGAWQLSFPPKLGAPATAVFDRLRSWTESTNDGIKYFSGTAAYEKDIEIPAEYLGAGRKLFLDLGAVKNLAAVSLNGKSLGILWKEPFRVDITDAANAGANKLVVRVTNLWPNRMIGDQKLPEAQRITWASVQPYKADSPLLPSGLLGPVRVVPAQTLAVGRP
jgi:hypothetical protein